MILLGVDVKWFLLQHLRARDGKSLNGLVGPGGCGGGPVAGAGTARDHHDDVPVVPGPALHLDHPLPGGPSQLLELDLLTLPLHLDWLVDQGLPVSGLQDLLPVLYLNDLLLSRGCWQDLDLLRLDVAAGPLDLDLLAAGRHVLHDYLLARCSLDDLLALAGRDHPGERRTLVKIVKTSLPLLKPFLN